MVKKELILKIFSASYMQRWNDKLRPMQFIELDKQAHKMVIAYFLGKFEEEKSDFNWIDIIEAGIFEFLQRIVITDIKPTILYKIKEDEKRYKEFNLWIYKQLEPLIEPLGKEFCDRFINYFLDTKKSIAKRILSAAHIYSSKWEFEIIERANPNGYDIDFIKKDFEEKMEEYYDLEGLKQLALYNSYKKFIDLCGQLRFQIRWANLHRIPQTSVLGHSLFVAMLSYFFSIQINANPKRVYNNYFTGLFHDLPEVLTRDIISPVKKSIEGLSDLIKSYEKEQMEKIVYPLIPKRIHDDIEKFTEDEFQNFIFIDGKKQTVSSDDINKKYNFSEYEPRDGEILKAFDELSAYIEAIAAVENGSKVAEFTNAIDFLKEKYQKKGVIGGVNFKELFEEF
ncbi:MAG: hydrolase [Spirochaetes bacterium GWC1_27_15]|nr:MAG: hydrolase [Spirochaetes bacterium GWC1_27_15]